MPHFRGLFEDTEMSRTTTTVHWEHFQEKIWWAQVRHQQQKKQTQLQLGRPHLGLKRQRQAI